MSDFKCPKCYNDKLEEVMKDVTVVSNIDSFEIEDGEIFFNYGEQSNEGGEIECYQCMSCGEVIASSQQELVEHLSIS